VSEGVRMRELLQPDQFPLPGTCRGRGCKKGKVQTEPGVWKTCNRCHGSGYDTEPPRVRKSSTSMTAAASAVDSAHTLRARLLEALRETPGGLGDEELQERCGLSGNSERPRRRELERQGLIEASGVTRPTRSGRQAVVWRLIKGAA
jgi:hypothetical protein